ncbi:MAG: CotH kinase family protein [Spirochaetia bacterium]|nr:CotH kinase family protein [Spirochaetia bacterium]
MILKIKRVCLLLLSCVLFLNFSCDAISQNEKSDKTNESEIPPSAPLECEIFSYGRDSSVFLKWKEPSSVSFSNIKIQYKKTGESVYSVKNNVSQKVKQYNVSGLKNNCEYDFIFSASGSDGKIYEKSLKQTPSSFDFKYFYDTALIAGGKTYISFALEENCQEISDFHVYRESDQKEIGDYTVKKDILAYEEIDKEQASTDQTKTFEKYYSILIEDETASSETTYLIRAVNSKNQESKEHPVRSRKLNIPVVSVNLGLSEENFASFKKKGKISASLSVFSNDNRLTDAPLTIKGRGNSSWFNAPKKSYTIKFKEKQKFLGFDSNKSFALIANYFDKTLLRNITAYSLAKKVFTKMSWAPSAKTVHLFIDGVYQGLYSAVETVKIAKNRVNIPDISDFVSSQETTKFEDYGFILEVNERKDENFNFDSGKGVPFSLKELDGKDLNDDICQKIKEKTNSVEEKLYQGDFLELDLDLYSFADWWIVEELAKNTDSQFYSSCYMYFDPSDKKIHMGPVWDFDLGFGNNGVDVKTEGFQADEAQNGANWILELRKSEEFKNIVKERWNTCKPLIESYFSGEYEENLSNIKKDVDVNFIRWPILGKSVWKAPNDCESRTTYDSEVEYFKTWKDNRIQWLSSQFE